MELWLFRHGKAEPLSKEKPDSKRELLEKGRMDSRKMGHYLKEQAGERRVRLLLSPLKRAQETGKILQKYLDASIMTRSEIAEGDLIGLLAYLEKNKAEIQIIVGHEPFLAQWLYQITGVKQEFSTASVAMIQMEYWSPPKGKLICYRSPVQVEE